VVCGNRVCERKRAWGWEVEGPGKRKEEERGGKRRKEEVDGCERKRRKEEVDGCERKRRKEDVGGYERKRWKEVRRGESIRNEYGRTRRKRRVDVRTLG